MKKRFLLLTTVAVFAFLGVAFGSYWYIKLSIPTLLKEALTQSRASGFTIAFEQEVPPKGALIDLKNIKIENSGIAYFGTVDYLKLKASVRAAWPLMNIRLELKKPKVSVDLQKRSPTSEKSESTPSQKRSFPLWLAAIPYLASVEVVAYDLEATPWGILKADLDLSTENISMNRDGFKQVDVKHQVFIKELSLPKLRNLPSFSVSGKFKYNNSVAYITDTSINLGPIRLQTFGKYDLNSKKWNLDIEIPERNFSEIAVPKEQNSVSWVKSGEGKISFRATSQGLGSDLSSINSEGELRAENLKLVLEHPVINGMVVGNLTTKFRKAEDSTLSAYLDLNLDQVSIHKNNQFKKSIGVPLNAKFKISGKDQEFQVEQGEFQFNNLKSEITGTIINGPKITTRLKAAVAQTSLTGWEQFFPSLPGIKTQGSFEGGIFYSGTTEDWRAASVEFSLNAKNVQIPVFKDWLPDKSLTLNGITKINSQTKISLSQGQLKNLATDTSIDLKEINLGYADLFLKPRGTPMSADLVIKSSSKEASFKNSTIKIGPIAATLKGNITDFSSPVAQLKIETNGVRAQEISELIPLFKSDHLNISDGIIKNTISIDGPLLSKDKAPGVSIESQIKSLALDLKRRDSPKTIHFSAISGVLFASKNKDRQTSLKTNSIKFNSLGGRWIVNGSCSGDDKSFRCNPTINLATIEIENLVPIISSSSDGKISGKLNATLSTQFIGLNESEIRRSFTAKGPFTLMDGKFKTLKLAQKPLESLNKFPGLGSFLNKTNWDSTIKETTGYLSYQNGATILTNVHMNSQNFDLFAAMTVLDSEQNISSKPLWTPKETLLDRKILNALRGENGKPTVPLLIQGKAMDPSITVDEAFIQAKLSMFSRLLETEKPQKLLQDLKKRFGTSIKDYLKKGLSGFNNK
jgi:hypothetical protein